METTNFSQPTRQSSKGILIIFAFKTFQFFRKFGVFFLAFGFSIMKKKYLGFLTPTNLILILLFVLFVILIIAILNYQNFKFHVSLDDFHLTRGIINKDNTIIPKSKIQNVYLKQNWLQQLINVVSVNIETAGDQKSEIEISALDRSTALQLKSELYSVSSQLHDENHEVIENNVFFKASPKRLLLEGISKNHLRSFAIIASFVFGLYYEFKDYINNLSFIDRLEDSIQINEGSIVNVLIANAILVFIIVLISMLFSIVKTFIVNFNLQVIENKKTIEINKGLFNKVSLSLTPSRIQNIVVTTNRIKHYFGLHTLSVKQAMVNAKQRKNFEIIALEKHQLDHLLGKLLVNYDSEIEASKPKPYYKRILAYKMIFLISIINIPGFLIFGNRMWYINIALIVLAVLYIIKTYSKSYYKIDDEFITIGSGFIDTTTNILEIHKIQAVKLKQSMFQKRIEISSVYIYTASKVLKIPYVLEQEARSIYDYLLFKVESQDKDWM
ncbi:PH domain-containing protein [Psychroserpens damuponensis]|uniref:PH domain-containing protein n=1 Tax=Psychroserpens damuponensis TaxID=943936 RepID=UPI00058DA583|nr:PH domain-containing protein [Psychroserpens damuponensis]